MEYLQTQLYTLLYLLRQHFTRAGLKHRPYDVGCAVADCCKIILRMPGIVGARGKTRPNRIKSKHNGIALGMDMKRFSMILHL
jgi:hypothetical protein